MAKKKTKARARSGRITKSSTAEYFSKNLQQVGFSSPTKAVLTTLKEAVDNSLDACEDHGILPDLRIEIEKLGPGSLKNTDKIKIIVSDNGPGIGPEDVPRVFGEYLASSKFGRGRCSRGQQGIGISAATTWAQQTTATGARVISKTAKMRKAVSYLVEVDLKGNKGRIKEKETVDWDRKNGTSVEFVFDGRLQYNGEAGIHAFINGNILVNPHMTLVYKIPGRDEVTVSRVTDEIPRIPEAVDPHPHTMKLGEFISHAGLFGTDKTTTWLRKGFSRVSPSAIKELAGVLGAEKSILAGKVSAIKEAQIKKLYTSIQKIKLMAPTTSSVLAVGESGLAKSIRRLGEVDFISVHTRKPTICDFKPVQVEVAIARLKGGSQDSESGVSVIRFANRVPLQFDKASCAIVKSIQSVNWRTYGLRQSKGSLPQGSFIVAVSVVSPFIKFKNASKETIDAAEELVEEIRRGLMKAGQKLFRHLKREKKAEELTNKIQHLESFAPILVEILCRIVKAPKKRKEAADAGLRKILDRDMKKAKIQYDDAAANLEQHLSSQIEAMPDVFKMYRDPKKIAEEAEENKTDEEKSKDAEIAKLQSELGEDAAPKASKKTSKKKKTKSKKKSTTRKTKKKKVSRSKIAKPGKKKTTRKKATKKRKTKKRR